MSSIREVPQRVGSLTVRSPNPFEEFLRLRPLASNTRQGAQTFDLIARETPHLRLVALTFRGENMAQGSLNLFAFDRVTRTRNVPDGRAKLLHVARVVLRHGKHRMMHMCIIRKCPILGALRFL